MGCCQRLRWSNASILTLVLVWAGCGDDAIETDGAMPDAGPPDATSEVVPESPAPPVLTPCQPGWREETSESATTCSPWPETGRAECTGVEAHFPGEPGCRAIGTPCPTGDFPDDAPADAIFVLAGATGGDGSRAAPYGSIREAVRAAAFDATILVGPGTYDEAVAPLRQLTLRGVCPERTVLTNTANDVPVLSVDGAEVTVANLSIRDAEGSAILGQQAATTLHVDSVLIESVRFTGIGVIEGAHLEAQDLIVRGMRSRTDGRFGRGVDLEYGGTANIVRAVFEGARSEAIFVGEDSALTLEDSLLEGTLPQMADGSFGEGILVQSAGTAEVRRSVVSNNRGAGLGAFDEGSRIVVEDSVIQGTQVYEDDETTGFGLGLEEGATCEARRVLLTENAEANVLVEAATLSLEDVVARDASGRPNGSNGRGIQAQGGATLTLTRVLSEHNREVGLQALGSMVSGEDVVVQDTRGDDLRGDIARGIGAESNSIVELTRVRVTHVGELGIAGFGSGTRVTVSEVEVSDLEPSCAGTDCTVSVAAGIGAYESSAVVVRSFVVRGSPVCGVHVAEASDLDLEAGEITDNDLGACVQVADYDLTRLTDGVLYRDNGSNLDSTSLPVPEPAAGLGL